MQLYTVRMNRQVVKTIFEASGKREEITAIEEVYTDLPHATAVTYQVKFPNANVRIEAQSAVVGEKRCFDFRSERRTETRAPKPVTKRDEGYAGVVNKMMEKG